MSDEYSLAGGFTCCRGAAATDAGQFVGDLVDFRGLLLQFQVCPVTGDDQFRLLEANVTFRGHGVSGLVVANFVGSEPSVFLQHLHVAEEHQLVFVDIGFAAVGADLDQSALGVVLRG